MKTCAAIATLLLTAAAAARAAGGAHGRIAVVGPDTVNLGEYSAAQAQTARFRIRNIGDAELRIVQIRKGCGCAEPKASRMALAPGEESEIEIVILANSIFGEYSKPMFVETTDRYSPVTTLTVAGHARPLVAVTPHDFVYTGRLPLDRPWSCSYRLTPTAPGVRLGTPRLEGALPVAMRAGTPEGGDGRETEIMLAYTPTESGDFRCTVTVPIESPTNHPPLKLAAAGTLGCELVAIPASLLLRPADVPAKRAVRLRLIGESPVPYTPANLALPVVPGLTIAFQPDPRPQTLLLQLGFDARFLEGRAADSVAELPIAFPRARPVTLRVQMGEGASARIPAASCPPGKAVPPARE